MTAPALKHPTAESAAAAARLLHRPLPDGYLAESTRHFAQPKVAAPPKTISMVVFRVEAEWFALPTPTVLEIAPVATIHALPHRGGATLGLANVHGALLICIALRELLGIAAPPAAKLELARFLVVQGPHGRLVLPVQEVRGVHRVHSSDLRDAPAHSARPAAGYISQVLAWNELTVGCLEPSRFFPAIERSLA